MKSLAYLVLAVLSLFLNACNEDDAEAVPVEAIFTVDEVIAKATATVPATLRPVALHHPYDTVTQAETTEGERFGPFTVASTLQRALTNHQVILTTAEGYKNAIYLCDIYRSMASVTLPSGALLLVDSVSATGYASYDAVPKWAGFYTAPVGSNTHLIIIWHIIPRYTQGGETVANTLLPTDTVGPTFTYFYLQDN